MATILHVIATAFVNTGTGADASRGLAKRSALNALVLIARLEGKLGKECPPSVSNTRSALESAMMDTRQEAFDAYVEIANQEAMRCPVLRTAEAPCV